MYFIVTMANFCCGLICQSVSSNCLCASFRWSRGGCFARLSNSASTGIFGANMLSLQPIDETLRCVLTKAASILGVIIWSGTVLVKLSRHYPATLSNLKSDRIKSRVRHAVAKTQSLPAVAGLVARQKAGEAFPSRHSIG